jgi:hypothetical protein
MNIAIDRLACRAVTWAGLLVGLLGMSAQAAYGGFLTVTNRSDLAGPGQAVDDAIDWSVLGPPGTTIPPNQQQGGTFTLNTRDGEVVTVTFAGVGTVDDLTVGTLDGLPSVGTHDFASYSGGGFVLARMSISVFLPKPVVAAGADLYALAEILNQPVTYGAATEFSAFDANGFFLAGGNLGQNPFQGFLGFRSDSGPVISRLTLTANTVFQTAGINQEAFVQLNRIDLVSGSAAPAAPGPPSLVLLSLGALTLAGYGWRRVR